MMTDTQFQVLRTLRFAPGAPIDLWFKTKSDADFIDFFNTQLAGKAPFEKRVIQPGKNETMQAVKREFATFWGQIPAIYKKEEISMVEFAALMCIALNETGGRFRSRTEICGAGREDATTGQRHEGLAYAFNAIPKVKRSYNVTAGNRTAFECFSDPVFCNAHKNLALSARFSTLQTGVPPNEVWKGEVYPVETVPVMEDLAVTGFIMQADFYKFRGRGPIQITGRGAYRPLAADIQKYTGENAVLNQYKNTWANLTPDDACSVSLNQDWDAIFGQQEIVAASLRVYADAASPARNLFHIESTLEHTNANKRTPHSIYNIGRTISGSDDYALNTYLPRVFALLGAITKIAG